MMPPERSQNLAAVFFGETLPLIIPRAESTNPRGTPQSGTGIATHSLWGFSTVF
jgi:hypothetical protein